MSRLARQLATESGLFVAMAAGLGVLVSFWLATVLRGLPLVREAQWIDVQVLDWRVLAFTAAVIVILGLIVSLAPIAAVRRLGIAQSSQHAVSRASLAQGFANSAQIALAGTIGGAAIAFGWYLAPMMFGDQGFTLANRFLVQQAGYIRNTIEAEASVELPRRREFIEAIPGVERVAFGYPVPGDDTMRPARRVTNEFGAEIEYRTGMLSHDLVELLGIRMVYGRAPTEEEPRALAVNQAFARAYWGRDDVVGERLPQFSNAGAAITGVLEDFAFGHPAEPVEPFVFEFHYYGDISLDAVLESRLTVAELQPEIDRLIAEGSLELPWSTVPVRSLRSTRNELIAADRARGVLTIVAASVVLGLAGFGIYGTQRYLVAAGRREYAIRAAVGAGPASLGRLVLRRGLMLGLPGMAVGGLLSFIAVAWLGDEFLSRDVAPAIVTGWVVGGLVLLLLLASLSPAREAKRIQAAEQFRDG
jgi:hypothetical protein